MISFRKGDLVRCINNDNGGEHCLTTGQTYTVASDCHDDNSSIIVIDDNGVTGGWYKARFVPVEKKEAPFYMLYIEGGGTPTFKHETLESAKTEAERLATKYGKKVFLLIPTETVEVQKAPVVWTKAN